MATESPLGRDHLGQTEVQDLSVTALRDEDVGGLDVAVNDVLTMRGIESISNFGIRPEEAPG